MRNKKDQLPKKRTRSLFVAAQGPGGTLVDRFLSDPFGSWQGLATLSQRSMGEVEETREAYILSAALPGMSTEEIKISLHGKNLPIAAESHEQYGTQGSGHDFRRSSRSFQQTFALPEIVDAAKIAAACDDGILRVIMPKRSSIKD